MSAVQNWSRCRRQTSRSICCHSRARLDRDAQRARGRSSRSCATACVRLSPRLGLVGLALSAAIARRRLPSRTTRRRAVAAPARSARPCRPASRCEPVAKSKSSSLPAASLWPPRPCAPTMGSTRPDHLAVRRRRRAGRSGSRRPGTPPRGCAMPSRSTRIGAAASAVGVAAASRSRPRPSGPSARLERRPPAGLQRDQVRPRRAREAQLELDAVVDRVEGAQRQEVEVLARRDRTTGE